MDIVDTTNFRVRKQVRVLRSIGGAPLQWGNGPRRTRPMLGVELPGMLRDELGVPVTVDLFVTRWQTPFALFYAPCNWLRGESLVIGR
jgi:hypothetical protein